MKNLYKEYLLWAFKRHHQTVGHCKNWYLLVLKIGRCVHASILYTNSSVNTPSVSVCTWRIFTKNIYAFLRAIIKRLGIARTDIYWLWRLDIVCIPVFFIHILLSTRHQCPWRIFTKNIYEFLRAIIKRLGIARTDIYWLWRLDIVCVLYFALACTYLSCLYLGASILPGFSFFWALPLFLAPF